MTTPADPTPAQIAVGVALARRHHVTTGGPRRGPRHTAGPALEVAGVVATLVTALVLGLGAMAGGAYAVSEWLAAGDAGLNDPDLHGLGALMAAAGALTAGVPAMLLLVAAFQQRGRRPRSGVVLSAVVHAPVALYAAFMLLAAPLSPFSLVTGLITADAVVVLLLAGHRGRTRHDEQELVAA